MAAKPKRRKAARRGGTDCAPVAVGDNSSVSIRRIKNGYLVERSGTKRGKYFSEQVYSPTDPLKPSKVTRAIGGTS